MGKFLAGVVRGDVQCNSHHSVNWWPWLLVIVASTLAHSPACAADDMDEEILVRRLVPRDYKDLNFTPNKLQRLLSESPSRLAFVKPGGTLSGIIKDEFRVTSTWTPKAYLEFEAHVRQMNGIGDPSRELLSGQQLILPDMPQGSQTPTTPRDVRGLQAPITFGALQQKTMTIDQLRLLSSASNLAPFEVQIRTMKRSQLAALKLGQFETRDQQDAAGRPVPMQGRLDITLAAGASQSDALSDGGRTALGTFLQRTPKSRPYVVILDDSWPSQQDFQRSARFVIAASRLIRKAYSLQQSASSDSNDIKILEDEMQTGTTFCDSSCQYPQLKWHSSMIRKSLEDFTDLDTSGVVEVIYLPLNKAQRYAANVLGEMVRVTQLGESVTSQLVLKTSTGRYPPDREPGTPDHLGTEVIVKKMLAPAHLGTMPVPDTGASELKVSTDKSIVDAVVNFMVLYSAASQRPHFISMSWTVDQNTLPAYFRTEAYGLWFAAAGNDAKVNVHAEQSQFAARSAMPGDFIAVQNVATSACATSTLSANAALRIYGIAYPGRFDATHCGTSFSAPRVAWLLAARTAIKEAPVEPTKDERWTQWKLARMGSLFNLTKPSAPGEERYRMSMWQLLDEPTAP